MNHGLIHAAGPNPPNPGDARTLGYEERKLCTMLASLPGSFRMFCHAASVPEAGEAVSALVVMLLRGAAGATFARMWSDFGDPYAPGYYRIVNAALHVKEGKGQWFGRSCDDRSKDG